MQALRELARLLRPQLGFAALAASAMAVSAGATAAVAWMLGPLVEAVRGDAEATVIHGLSDPERAWRLVGCFAGEKREEQRREAAHRPNPAPHSYHRRWVI